MFSVLIIPHTLNVTNTRRLGARGAEVISKVDLMARYAAAACGK